MSPRPIIRALLNGFVHVEDGHVWPGHHFRDHIVGNIERAGLLRIRLHGIDMQRCADKPSVAQGNFRHAVANAGNLQLRRGTELE